MERNGGRPQGSGKKREKGPGSVGTARAVPRGISCLESVALPTLHEPSQRLQQPATTTSLARLPLSGPHGHPRIRPKVVGTRTGKVHNRRGGGMDERGAISGGRGRGEGLLLSRPLHGISTVTSDGAHGSERRCWGEKGMAEGRGGRRRRPGHSRPAPPAPRRRRRELRRSGRCAHCTCERLATRRSCSFASREGFPREDILLT